MGKHREKPLFTVEYVLGSRVAALCKQRAFNTHTRRPRINRVLHIGEFARSHSSWREGTRGTDADRVHHLLNGEVEHATGSDWCCKRGERCVMPTVLANTRETELAQTHFDFIRNRGSEQQVFAAEPEHFSKRERSRDDVAWMAWIRLPIDVVVIHRANHVIVQERRINSIRLKTSHKRCAWTVTFVTLCGHRSIVCEQDVSIFLTATTNRAADRVKPESLARVDGGGRK